VVLKGYYPDYNPVRMPIRIYLNFQAPTALGC
jgi:hypothetical protein